MTAPTPTIQRAATPAAWRHPDFRTDINKVADRYRQSTSPVAGPQRRIPPAQDDSPADFDLVGKIDLVTGRYDTFRHQAETAD